MRRKEKKLRMMLSKNYGTIGVQRGEKEQGNHFSVYNFPLLDVTSLGTLAPQTIAAQKSVENFMVIMLERIFSVFSWASFPDCIKKQFMVFCETSIVINHYF